jgi:hypothetical protein
MRDVQEQEREERLLLLLQGMKPQPIISTCLSPARPARAAALMMSQP